MGLFCSWGQQVLLSNLFIIQNIFQKSLNALMKMPITIATYVILVIIIITIIIMTITSTTIIIIIIFRKLSCSFQTVGHVQTKKY